MTTFQSGDRVVVESPVYTPRFEEATTDSGGDVVVGARGRVSWGPDFEGDYTVTFDNGSEHYVAAEGLLKVADLDRLAEERTPAFAVGDRLRVIAPWGFTVRLGEIVEVVRVSPSRVSPGEVCVQIRVSDGRTVNPYASNIAGKVEKVVEPEPVAIDEIVLTRAQIERAQAVHLATEILGKDALVESITAVARYIVSGVIAR